MMVYNCVEFPKNCVECPIRYLMGGCRIADNCVRSALEIPVDCPFEPAEPVVPGIVDCGVYHAPPNSYSVAECICLMCLKRFIDVRPEGLLLKDMECPGCHKTGFIIETGEYLTDADENGNR